MSDSKPTYFPIYCERFVVDTQLMTAEQAGAYMCLRVNAWLQTPPCTLPNSVPDLEILARVGRGRWPKVRDRVMVKFRLDGDRWICDELLDEYRKSLKRMEISRRNGGFGGRPPNNPAGSRQVPSGLAAGNPDQTQIEPIEIRDKRERLENEKEKELPPPPGPRIVQGQSGDFSDSIEPDPEATWMIRAVAKAVGYQLSSSQQYAITDLQAQLVLVPHPVIGGKPTHWRDVFEAACVQALQTAQNKSPVPFAKYAITFAKGAITDGKMPGAKANESTSVSSSEIDDILAKGK